MTLLEWVSAWWRTAAPAGQQQISIAPAPRPKPRVPSEYVSLYTYLEHRYASTVVLTFEQMEALLGFALPEPASTQDKWWSNPGVHADRHSDAWTVARRTATPNLLARTVTFERLP